MIEQRGVTLVGIAVGNLEDGRAVQLSLPLARHSTDALDAALDEVWLRFGSGAITRAVLLRRGSGIAMPVLPD
jgi:DNA polymerase-4